MRRIADSSQRAILLRTWACLQRASWGQPGQPAKDIGTPGCPIPDCHGGDLRLHLQDHFC